MLAGLFERRGAFQNLWGSGALFDRSTPAGITVNEDTSLRLTAVYACVRLISDTISTLPLDQYIRRDGQRFPFRPKEQWVENPSTRYTRTTFWKQVLISLLVDGNAFVHVMRGSNGQIVNLEVLNPSRVDVVDNGGTLEYVVDNQFRLSRQECLHVTEMLMPGELRGRSRVKEARDSLGLGLALEEYASRFFGNGAYAGGIIEWPGALTAEQRDELAQSWDAGHRGVRRSHRPAVLYGGAKFVPTSIDPSQSMLVDQRKFAVEEVARIFRVPPFMLGMSENAAMAFASIEQQQIFFRQHTIQPYVEILEDHFHRLLAEPRSFIKFNLSSLVRADLGTRTASYSTALLAGYMSVNDVRALEDLRPVDNGDEYRVPLQNVPLTDTPVITLKQKATIAQALTVAGYTGESIAQLLDLPLEHTGLLSVQTQPAPDGFIPGEGPEEDEEPVEEEVQPEEGA